MDGEELLRLLKAEAQKPVGFVRHTVELAPGVRVKEIVALEWKAPAPPGLYSWHHLMENPSYVREQKIIQTKPFKVYVNGFSRTPQAWYGVEVYFADLEEVAVFLEQFGNTLSDFHVLSNDEMSL